MDVRQTCTGWKKISPEAVLSRLHICALCGQTAGASQAVNENMLSWETYWQTGRVGGWSDVAESSKAVCLTVCHQIVFILFFPFQIFTLSSGCETIRKAAVHLRTRYWNAVEKSVIKPLLQDELCFEPQLIINSFSAYFCLFVLNWACFLHYSCPSNILLNAQKTSSPQGKIFYTAFYGFILFQCLLSVSDCNPSTFL